jgi:BolA family transcriptional regulator, general stress-responsive regulator
MTPTPSQASVPTAEALEATLRQRLAPTHLEVLDESAAHAGHAGSNGLGYGTHFRVRIGGPALAGLNRVQAHRLVYDALQPYIDAGLHALAIEVQR